VVHLVSTFGSAARGGVPLSTETWLLVCHGAGHNDVLAGALCGSKKLVSEVRKYHHVLGGVVDSHAAYLVLRGMKTLKLRVCHQNDTALRLARVLEKHPKISKVHYPGLESHPEHAIAKRQMSGYGGVLSFEVDADLMTTAKFVDGA
jgi:cystathionine gamma-synthase